MPHIKSKVDFAASFEKGKHKLLDSLVEVSWRSYVVHRDAGASHEQCMKWGIGYESFKERYSIGK